MVPNEEIDLENLEPPPSILESLHGGSDVETGTVRRQRTSVMYSKLEDETENTAPKRVDYTFRGRHIEMMAIGISLLSNQSDADIV